MLTLEKAAQALFSPRDFPSGSAFRGAYEIERLAALRMGAQALADMEALGLCCGIFGSALRSGDFFHNSDVDIAAWTQDLSTIDPELALRSRLACHQAMGAHPFDLVLLPCSNQAFSERILNSWMRGRGEVERAARGEPMAFPVVFGPSDVAFIDADRLAIAARASQRMASRCSPEQIESHPQRAALSLCASMQTIVRVAEKCAKDVLRELVKIRPPLGQSRPLYPLLAYPSEALGAMALASSSSLALYFECCDLLEPPESVDLAWASRMALMASLFTRSMSADFDPGIRAMAQIPTRTNLEVR